MIKIWNFVEQIPHSSFLLAKREYIVPYNGDTILSVGRKQ